MPPSDGVEIQLADSQHTLRYTWPALRKLQQTRNGEGLAQTLVKAGQIEPDAITALVWAGLLHEKKDLAISDVWNLVVPPLPRLLTKCVEALKPWLDEGEEEGKADGAVAS